MLVSQNPDADVLLDHIVVVAQGKPDYKPAVFYHVPAPGDAVPDFKLRNQDGRAIHLDQFRGKALLITFIYTRCPLPNFCPLVTHNFAVINRELAVGPRALRQNASALRQLRSRARHARRGCGPTARSTSAAMRRALSAHWDFAVPSKPELLKMAKYFDVGITHGADDTITHTLSTTLIGPAWQGGAVLSRQRVDAGAGCSQT